MNSIRSAIAVMTSEYIPYQAAHLVDESTPENSIMESEKYKALSDEAKYLANIIINMPDEFFLVNGKVTKKVLRQIAKKERGWSARKVDEVRYELGFFLKMRIFN